MASRVVSVECKLDISGLGKTEIRKETQSSLLKPGHKEKKQSQTQDQGFGFGFGFR